MTEAASATPAAKRRGGFLRDLGTLGVSTTRAVRGFGPLVRLLATEGDVGQTDLSTAIDRAFVGLYKHPLVLETERFTRMLRRRRLIPDEESTEDLIRFIVQQVVARSPVPVPQALVDEFWRFFNELFSSPELKGLGALTLDMVRLVIKSYEPLLVEVVNLLKAGRRFNQWQAGELLRRAAQVGGDVAIVRRQLRALRYVRPFFKADPKDFRTQAQIVAKMVREFGPFFIKMAQVAAANADFLPEEIARELAVFQEDVPPMSAEEVIQAFMECRGTTPDKLYMDFDADKPLRSGSIGSVYVAKKPFLEEGVEVLRPVVIKVGRHNLDREFAIGKLVIGLAILSTQYWAPHSKLAPFLRAMQEQVDEFVAGFVEELDFDAEARNQQRFRERARTGGAWHVPAIYTSTPRVIEMEYLAGTTSLACATANLPKRKWRHFQAGVTRRLLHTVLQQIILYGELHGDLHPGNIMLDEGGTLYLIDWGNVVPLTGKWATVRDYLVGALLADSELLADAVIAVSTQPEANRARRDEVVAAMEDVLGKKGVTRVSPATLYHELRDEGWPALQRRMRAVAQIISSTQAAGLVVRGDYLHLSRAVAAVIGSFGTLYPTGRRHGMLRDLSWALATAPMALGREAILAEGQAWRVRLKREREVHAPQVMPTGAMRHAPPPMPPPPPAPSLTVFR
ncbi:MAG TPA: AarF/ABC1/UbiB kinase family protein [Nevskiaceae bacterium]|nr:AarF/ABC1/UbiB kinase family protein [Nevskiaceae bacterium]